MILVDTSVWIGFFRGEARTQSLHELLDLGEAALHAWTLGELVLGNLGRRRTAVLRDLGHLPTAPEISSQELFLFVEKRRLFSRGIGWVDGQLLASALAVGGRLWTLDRKLRAVAEELDVALST
jgi:predicted nucleic acid-binding protein